ncbi:hypothetical protein IM40_09995 (plasmid) [Candidatus Paracaedimonas acanthamoebae]|nr:hypothetical protein IM40_09995 [Candidatus Paracaedimonas acanthamoebae]
MAKKNFRGGFDSLISSTEHSREENAQHLSLSKHEKRATFIIQNDHLEKIKAISYWERKMIKDVLSDALDQYLSTYEKAHGKILLPELKHKTQM